MVLLENLEVRSSKNLSKDTFLVTSMDQSASQMVQSALSSRADRTKRILPMKTFELEASHALGLETGLSTFDLKVLLLYMSRDTGDVVYNERV